MSIQAIPRQAAVRILRKTLRSLGYSRAATDLAIWSTLWLEDRDKATGLFGGGVSKLLLYMMMVKDIPYEDLKPKSHPDFVLGGKCPFLLSGYVIQKDEFLMEKMSVAFGAPVVPILMLPLLINHFARRGFNIEMKYETGTFVGTPENIKVTGSENDRIGLYSLPNTDNSAAIQLKLVPRLAPSQSLKIQKTKLINLPEVRLQGKGPLRLN